MREPINIGKRRDGTDHVVHRWVPDPDVIHLAKKALEMRAAGKSYKQIHEETRLYGSMNSYATFFTNKLYTGELVYGELVIPDYCEPIVDSKTWDRVQALHRKHHALNNPWHPRRSTSDYILSGVMKCARCGSPMNGHVIGSTKGKIRYFYYYRCSRRTRRKDCDSATIPQPAIEKAILDEIKSHILTPENLAAVQAEERRIWKESQGGNDHERKRLNKESGSLDKQINNVTDSIAKTGGSQALLEKLQALERERVDLQTKLSRLNESTEPLLELDYQEISSRINEAIDLERDGVNRQQIKDLLRNLIPHIDIVREGKKVKGDIYYYSLQEEVRTYRKRPRGEMTHKHGLEITLGSRK